MHCTPPHRHTATLQGQSALQILHFTAALLRALRVLDIGNSSVPRHSAKGLGQWDPSFHCHCVCVCVCACVYVSNDNWVRASLEGNIPVTVCYRCAVYCCIVLLVPLCCVY